MDKNRYEIGMNICSNSIWVKYRKRIGISYLYDMYSAASAVDDLANEK